MSEPAENPVEPTREAEGAAVKRAVIDAALPHVVFDGWSDKALAYAIEDAGVDPGAARLAFPRGGLDLALGYHFERDADLAARLRAEPPVGRFRERVAGAVMARLELVAGEREAVRRGVALFALPHHAADGARGIWHTADVIWTALGDTSRDFNWYSKRTTLSAVYSSALLYWLGDDTPEATATRQFIDRRIADVMRFEEAKGKIAKNPLAAAVLKLPMGLLDRVKAPGDSAPPDLPGGPRRHG